MAYTQTTQDIAAALMLRLNALGYALPQGHMQAIIADVLQVCGVTDNANVAAHTATDSALLKPPGHKKF